MAPNLIEARRRSVDNLQRLYTVVISLAVAESLRRILGDIDHSIPDYKQWLMFGSLMATVIPFYHGANRYLDATYVTGERSAKDFALLIDFISLFGQGILFFVLAMVINNEKNFYTLFGILLLTDVIWVGITKFTTAGEVEKSDNRTKNKPNHGAWALINIIAISIVMIFLWSNLWPSQPAYIKSVALFSITVIRTGLDYYFVYDFYYPNDIHDSLVSKPALIPESTSSTITESVIESIKKDSKT